MVLWACLCETSVFLASKIKISTISAEKTRHSAGKKLEINWDIWDNLQGTENTVIGNNNAFIQQIIICFIAVIH